VHGYELSAALRRLAKLEINAVPPNIFDYLESSTPARPSGH
jgi:hypothetical protein